MSVILSHMHNQSRVIIFRTVVLCSPLLSIMSTVFEGRKCKKVVCACCFSRIIQLQSQNDFIMFNSLDEKTS